MTPHTPTRPPQTGKVQAEVTRLFCTDCGTRNSADSKYCKECGGKINEGYRTMMQSIEAPESLDEERSQQRLTRLLDMAFWHNEAGHALSAIRAAEAALVIQPDSTTAHSLLGTLYEKQGDDAKAIEHLEAVVALNPDSAADAAKLDQVRRGVRVKAVAQPPAYKWTPPALAGMKWDTVKGRFTETTWPAWRENLRKHPALASAAAVVLVGAVGALAIRPSAPARPRTGRVALATPTPTPQVALNAPAQNTMQPGAFPPPVAQWPQPNTNNVAPAKKVAANPDPFSETLAPGTPTVSLIAPPRRSRPARVVSAAPVGAATSLLPPLALRAVQMPSKTSLAPAPVSIPASAQTASSTTVPGVPQHTVVVPSLAAAVSPAPAGGDESGGNIPGSHIRISINNTPTARAITISDGSLPPAPAPRSGGGDDGDSYQQSAIQYQQQGDFAKARAAYQKAIRAFKAQITAGHDAEAAKRGLQASQTGLQICEQSQ